MELQKEIVRVLKKLNLSSMQVEFKETPEGKVGGFIISESFRGMPQSKRQDMIWDVLDERLSLPKRSRITALLTMTPAEADLPEEKLDAGRKRRIG